MFTDKNLHYNDIIVGDFNDRIEGTPINFNDKESCKHYLSTLKPYHPD